MKSVSGSLECICLVFQFFQNQACLNAGGNFQHLLEHVVSYIIYITPTNVRPLNIPCVWVQYLMEFTLQCGVIPAAQKILPIQDIDIIVVLTRIMERVNFKIF
jgi:hypothetical protein